MLIFFLSFYPPKYLNLFCNGYREESDKKTVALTQLDEEKFVGFFLLFLIYTLCYAVECHITAVSLFYYT